MISWGLYLLRPILHKEAFFVPHFMSMFLCEREGQGDFEVQSGSRAFAIVMAPVRPVHHTSCMIAGTGLSPRRTPA